MSTSSSAVTGTATATATSDAAARGDYYFHSYGHYGIHMEMLKDQTRTETYRNAILMNRFMFKDKVVLDVGCGTGILSMFAARAGAKKVFAVECSSIAHQARAIVKENGLDDVISVIHGKMEEVELPKEFPKVDIIISEWMGYFLLYESMLNSVLFARDKFGAKDVKLLPNKSNMHICAITDSQYMHERFDIWNNVHGFDYSPFRKMSYIEPLIDSVDRNQIVTCSSPLFCFDLNTVKEDELAFKSSVSLTATRGDVVHALCVYFDTPFTAGHETVVLDTAPFSVQTHWRQTCLYLVNPIRVEKGEIISIQLTCEPNELNPRDLNIRIHVDFDGKYQVSHFDQDYRMR